MDGVVELQAIRLEGSTSMSHCTRDIVRFMALYTMLYIQPADGF